MTDISELTNYAEGVAKSSFCKPIIDQQYISLAHFLSLQPRECMKIRDEYYPDMIITTNKALSYMGSKPKQILYVWLPTPPKKSANQINYAKECRKRLDEVAVDSQFDEVWLDVRGNIGGVLSTVVDAVYPILANRLNDIVHDSPYLTGIDKNGKIVTTFSIKNNGDGIKHILKVSGFPIVTDILPYEQILADKFDGKPINILCNRYTMSTGEIMCIIVRKIGGKVYGEKTRGLTNGTEIISNTQVKGVYVPYYSIADGSHIYYDGVIPDK